MSRQRGTIVVTGAARGIGRAAALRLAKGGFHVLAGVRSDAAAADLTAAHDGIEPVILDVTNPEQIAALRAHVGDRALAGLVNNAGIVVPGMLEFVELDDLRRQLEVNVIGQVAVTQAVLPAIRAGRGRIVNIGSIGGVVPPPYLLPYTTSKGAIRNMSKSLRRELRTWGIHVALVEPGTIDTDMWETGYRDADELLAKLPPEGRELYGPQLAAMRKASERVVRMAIAPDKVAKAIEHALTARRPKARYGIGFDTRVMRGLDAVLPARTFDALFARLMGSR